ncbi:MULTISPECIES: hypothetical protein [unclassified Streptomyces]|uniref:hypothetical protein n=1 Tax=unclassified Streptomyces TaxID=2593676 RepID=UPI0038148856
MSAASAKTIGPPTAWPCPRLSRSTARIDRLIGRAPTEARQWRSADRGPKGGCPSDRAAARSPAAFAVSGFDGDEPTRQRPMPARRGLAEPDETGHCLAGAHSAVGGRVCAAMLRTATGQ